MIFENVKEVDLIVSCYFDEFVYIISVRDFVWKFKIDMNNVDVLSSDILGLLFI